MAVSTPMVLVLASVVPATAGIQTHQQAGPGFGVALGNDYLNFFQRGNDRGFTSDLEAYLLVVDPNRSVQVGVRHTIFRADTSTTPLRFDIGRVYLSTDRAVASAGPVKLSWTHFAEGVYRGDLGGSDMQNFVHHWPGIHGETFGDGLSDDYPQNPRLGVEAGLGWRASLDLSWLMPTISANWWLGTSAQVAPLSTGVTKVEAMTGVRVEAPVAQSARMFTATQVGTGWAVSNDPFLELPGGYTNELGAVWGPTLVFGLRFRAGTGQWLSASLRATRNHEGTGTRRGSGPMGWLVIEWGGREVE